jgi:hypothetical protein
MIFAGNAADILAKSGTCSRLPKMGIAYTLIYGHNLLCTAEPGRMGENDRAARRVLCQLKP